MEKPLISPSNYGGSDENATKDSEKLWQRDHTTHDPAQLWLVILAPLEVFRHTYLIT